MRFQHYSDVSQLKDKEVHAQSDEVVNYIEEKHIQSSQCVVLVVVFKKVHRAIGVDVKLDNIDYAMSN